MEEAMKKAYVMNLALWRRNFAVISSHGGPGW